MLTETSKKIKFLDTTFVPNVILVPNVTFESNMPLIPFETFAPNLYYLL